MFKYLMAAVLAVHVLFVAPFSALAGHMEPGETVYLGAGCRDALTFDAIAEATVEDVVVGQAVFERFVAQGKCFRTMQPLEAITVELMRTDTLSNGLIGETWKVRVFETEFLYIGFIHSMLPSGQRV